MAIMTQPFVSGKNPDFAVMLTFLSGVIILIIGLLDLGFLVQFISSTVISGFTSAAALTIASGQITSLLGLPGHGTSFLEAWINLFKNWRNISLWDTVLGITSIFVLFVLQQIGSCNRGSRNINKYLSLGRNAIVVIIGTVLAYCLSHYNKTPFQLTGSIIGGLPPISLPPFSTEVNNNTVNFQEMVTSLGIAPISISLIAILEIVTIATIFCEKDHTVDATQEMLAVGICNILGSFVSSMPVTGSFTRSAVNNSSGVRSPFSGIFTGSLVILALGFLTSCFYFIPKPTLAGVIIAAMFPMMELSKIKLIWNTNRTDTLPLITTILACLFVGLELGIMIGIGSNIAIELYISSKPKISIEIVKFAEKDLLVATPDQYINFTAADHFRSKLTKSVVENRSISTVIIDGRFINRMDISSVKKLCDAMDVFQGQTKEIILWNWRDDVERLICRYNPKCIRCFKSAATMEELCIKIQESRISANLL